MDSGDSPEMEREIVLAKEGGRVEDFRDRGDGGMTGERMLTWRRSD